MRRGGLVALFLVACAAAGLLAAALVTAAPLAEAQTGTTGTTATTTTTPPTTTAPPPTTTAPPPTTTAPLPTTTAPPPTTTAPRPKPKPKPKPRPRTTIRPSVAIAGTLVGGLTPAQARLEVQATFKRPLAIVVGKRVFKLTPQQVGAASYLGDAVKRAYRAPAGKDVSLRVRVPRANVEGWLNPLAERFYRAPVDSQLVLRGVTPFATREWPGRRLDVLAARKAIIFALWKHDRTPIRLRFEAVAPRVTRASHGDAIVIRRGSNRLYYYNGTALVRSFGVATGQSSYPTPLGAYHIVVMWRNPWWYPPASDWAKDAEPIPPGPGNPLGTRWMGISAPAVGIHGTPDAASIGYSASHGCIRMTIPEAEWLFGQVNIGTPVYIVSA